MSYLILLDFIFLLLGIIIAKSYLKKGTAKITCFEASKISVVIPFRNEEEHLPKIIAAIKALQIQPLEIIWVNDHSEDNSILLLQQLPSNQKMFSLPSNVTGKKNAIKLGIEIAKGTHILTWDADIVIQKNFFSGLKNEHLTDLLVLPVQMKSSFGLETFYELDYYFVNALNKGLSSTLQPFIANGANLLFDKEKYFSTPSYKYPPKIASGDDMFLLNDFKSLNYNCRITTNPKLIAKTETPKTFKEFIQQRLRWAKKTPQLNDPDLRNISLIGLFIELFYLFFLFTDKIIFCILIKTALDGIFLIPFLIVIQRKKIIPFLPIFSLLHPIYILVIGCLIPFTKVTWKNRTFTQ